jgi:hypothetical protein
MSQGILNQIIEQLQTLESSELEQLSQVVQSYLVDREASTKQVLFHQALRESGLVRRIEPSTSERGTQQQLIQIQDEPISHTIIEERR